MTDSKSHDDSVKKINSDMTKVTLFALAFLFLFVLIFSLMVLNVSWVSLITTLGSVLVLTGAFMILSYIYRACAKALWMGSSISSLE